VAGFDLGIVSHVFVFCFSSKIFGFSPERFVSTSQESGGDSQSEKTRLGDANFGLYESQ
jgi:hypothetical protein